MAEIDQIPQIPEKLQAILSMEGENLVSEVDDIEEIRSRVMDGYALDLKSMGDYLDKYNAVLDLAGMKNDKSDKTFPFVGASKAKMPYLAQASVDFASRTVPEVVNRNNIAKACVWGQADWDEEERAKRVASAINWQLKKGIDGWEKSHDWALSYIPVIGMYFTKKWWEDYKIQEAMITADCMIYDHNSPSFEKAPRKSHKFDLEWNDYISYVVSGHYAEIDALKDMDQKGKVEQDLEMIETHMCLDLDGDGYGEPYIVTWCEKYKCITRIEAAFQEMDVDTIGGKVYRIKGERFFTQTGFIPSVEKPAIYEGYGTLFYDYLCSMNTSMQQLTDSGTLANIAGSSGFINSNIKQGGRARKGKIELIQGQLTPLDVGSGVNLNQSIWTMPFQGPNQGAYALYEQMREEFRVFTTAAQSVDANPGEAAALYLARLQQALKVPNAIMSRVYRGLGGEFNRIYDLMARYMSNEDYLEIIDWVPEIPPEAEQAFMEAQAMQQQMAQQGLPAPPPPAPEALALQNVSKEADFAPDPDIIPTADPTMGNEFERMARAEAIRAASIERPNLYNAYEVEKNYLEVMGEPRIDQILPQPSGEPDPMMIMQQQYMQADIQGMQMEAENKAAKVQMDRMKLELEMAKLEPEIDKLESEAVKNYAEVDDKQRNTLLKMIDAQGVPDMSGLSDDELWEIARGES